MDLKGILMKKGILLFLAAIFGFLILTTIVFSYDNSENKVELINLKSEITEKALSLDILPNHQKIKGIVLIVLGLVFLIVVPRLVGFVLKVIGLALFIGGIATYVYEPLRQSFPQFTPIIPIIAGLAIIFIGKGLAKTIVRIMGLALIAWGFLNMGLI
mgnify:CR=1 FL=1|jgi:uncharacterized membrane protein HdeD (DUF308 family)|tara:strand:+ start:1641 stop:2114 length:474 start_codon:yes stop_codon:yes gene_type:complete